MKEFLQQFHGPNAFWKFRYQLIFVKGRSEVVRKEYLFKRSAVRRMIKLQDSFPDCAFKVVKIKI